MRQPLEIPFDTVRERALAATAADVRPSLLSGPRDLRMARHGLDTVARINEYPCVAAHARLTIYRAGCTIPIDQHFHPNRADGWQLVAAERATREVEFAVRSNMSLLSANVIASERCVVVLC